MERSPERVVLIYALTVLAILLLDLITKNLAELLFRERDISLLPFLHLVLVYNRGVAFGLLADAPEFIRIPVLLVTPLVALVVTLLYALRVRKASMTILMGMVGGGALGNLYDRLFLGQVRDFIYLSYGGLSWPAFNLADASISIAIALFLLKSLFEGRRG